MAVHRHSTGVFFSAEELDILRRCHDTLFTEVLQFPLQSSKVGVASDGQEKDYLCVPVCFMEPTEAFVDMEMARVIAGLSEAKFKPVSWPCPPESLMGDMLLGVCHRDPGREQGRVGELHQVVRIDPTITPASEFPEVHTTYACYFKTKYNYDLPDLSQPALVCVPVGTQCLQLTTSRYKTADGRDLEKAKPNRERLFFPQQCSVYQLPAHMLHLALCLPLLLWRLENLLLVEEMRAQIARETNVGANNKGGREFTIRTVLRGYRDEGCYTAGVRCYNIADGTYKDVSSSPTLTFAPGHQSTGPDCGLLLQALTPKGANDVFNLERLEVLGDAFVKLVSTVSVSHSQTWELTKTRSPFVANLTLYTLAKQKGLTGKIQSSFRPMEAWLPPRFALPVDGLASSPRSPYLYHEITDKGVADCVEALAAAYVVAGGLDAGLSFLNWLNFREPVVSAANLTVAPSPGPNPNSWRALIQDPCSAFSSVFVPVPTLVTSCPSGHAHQVSVDSLRTRVPVDDLNALLRRCTGTSDSPTILGWTFKDPGLFVQAFTHSSYTRNWITDWYKRLEFLGDAVLDYLVTRYIYFSKTHFKPGEISGLKSALVNNSSFAQMAVSEKLHTYLLHSSPALFKHLQLYLGALEKALDGDGEEVSIHQACYVITSYCRVMGYCRNWSWRIWSRIPQRCWGTCSSLWQGPSL